jgi:hypothetical protein
MIILSDCAYHLRRAGGKLQSSEMFDRENVKVLELSNNVNGLPMKMFNFIESFHDS